MLVCIQRIETKSSNAAISRNEVYKEKKKKKKKKKKRRLIESRKQDQKRNSSSNSERALNHIWSSDDILLISISERKRFKTSYIGRIFYREHISTNFKRHIQQDASIIPPFIASREPIPTNFA